MSLDSTTSRNTYLGDGSTPEYDFTFRITNETHLRVTVSDGEEETLLVLGDDYTVDGVLDVAGGAITLVEDGQDWIDGDGNLDEDWDLVIRRVLPIKQTTDIRNGGPTYKASIEDVFDRLTMIDQQQQDELSRSLKMPETMDPSDFDPSMPMDLPGAAYRTIMTNADGDGFELGPEAGAIATGQSFALSVIEDLFNVVNVKTYDAEGDGVTDDYAAIMAAEAAAFAIDGVLYFPPGNYAVNATDRLGMRVSCYGIKGQSVITLTAAASANNSLGNYHSGGTAATGLIFDGLKVDAGGFARGIYLSVAHDCVVRNCEVVNAVNGGITAFGSNRVLIENNHVNGVDYGISLTDGDGIYLGGCSDCVVRENHVEDCERGGIVSESDGGTKSFYPRIVRNVIHNMHDCDDSVGEYNYGVWVENTAGAIIAENRIYDIGGNAGQTSARVTGIIAAQGASVSSTQVIRDNFIEVSTGVTPVSGYTGIALTGTATTNALVTGNHIKAVTKGIAINDGYDQIVLENNLVDGLQITSASSAALIVDNSGTKCKALRVKGLRVINQAGTGSTDYGHITFIAGGSGADLFTLTDCHELIMQTRAAGIAACAISNCELYWGNTTGYRAVIATRLYVANTLFTYYAGDARTGGVLVDMVASTDAVFVNCRFVNGQNILGGTGTGSLRFKNCHFDGFYFRADNTATYDAAFHGCYMTGLNATYGFFGTNESTPTQERLYFYNCQFQHGSNVAPIRDSGTNPTLLVIEGCQKNSTITAFHNFTHVTGVVVQDGVAVKGSTGAATAIIAGTGIVLTNNAKSETHFIAGSGGAVDVSANPQISAGQYVGQETLVVGTDDTNTVLLEDGTGLSMNGSMTLGAGDNILFRWNGSVHTEVSRREN